VRELKITNVYSGKTTIPEKARALLGVSDGERRRKDPVVRQR